MPEFIPLLVTLCLVSFAQGSCRGESGTSYVDVIREGVFERNVAVKVTRTGISFPSKSAVPALQSLTVSLGGEQKRWNGLSAARATAPNLASNATGIWYEYAQHTRDRSRRRQSGLFMSLRFAEPNVYMRILVRKRQADEYFANVHLLHVFTRPAGLVMLRTARNPEDAVQSINSSVTENSNGISLVGSVDHAAAANRVGLELPFSTVVAFGNPRVGTPLWRSSPEAGIELPLEILVAKSPLGSTYVCYNSMSVFRQRFSLPDSVSGFLKRADEALARIAGKAAGTVASPVGTDFDTMRLGGHLEGIVVETRPDGGAEEAAAAFERLKAALEKAPPVNIAYVVQHDTSARKAGLETDGNVNRVAVFGNPALGTVLMQSSFTAGIDLPLKMAVWTVSPNNSHVSVGYTTPEFIAARHGFKTLDPKLGTAAASFAGAALGRPL